MTAVATAIVGSAVVGAGVGIYASKKSADAQKEGVEDSISAQWEMFQQSRKDAKPWLEAGTWALGVNYGKDARGRSTGLYGMLDPDRPRPSPNLLRDDPGYQFRLAEGEKAVNRGAAAKGGLLGGAQQKALTRYGQDYASNEYDKYYAREMNAEQQKINNLMRMAGFGASATGNMIQANQQTGANIGQTNVMGGNARASGYINAANAITGNVRSGAQDWAYYNALKK